MKILIVRTSSLGDLIHLLPAVSDMALHRPDAQIDWLVEESFVEIAQWHRAVHAVIPVAHRRWRKSWWSTHARRERAALIERIGSVDYDVVIDMQSLLKSVWLVRAAHGVKHGLDWRSARESLCTLFYDVRHTVGFWQPAVIRQRTLAGAALGYTYSGAPAFGLDHLCQPVNTAEPYAVIMPSASRDDKLWPEQDWQAVFDRLQGFGLGLCLLAGSANETARAEQLIRGRANARVQPRSSLTELAKCLSGARLMVGLDSGLTHLSAALGVDTIGIYKASTPVRTPLTGAGFTASLGERNQPPDRQAVLSAIDAAWATKPI
jgi:heptosyltransferase-1